MSRSSISPERLIIAGGGRGVWEDLSNLPKEYHDADIMCINDIGTHFPRPFHHWFSLHGAQLPVWLIARGFRYKDQPQLHSSVEAPGVTVWDLPGHTSSGFNAVKCGLALGYNDIVLCGVPYDNDGHYFDPSLDHWIWGEVHPPKFDAQAFRRRWKQLIGKATSMSGSTRDVLGGP